MNSRSLVVVISLVSAALSNCTSNNNSVSRCDGDGGTPCGTGFVCETTGPSTSACFAPVEIHGRVIDATSSAGIAGAHIVALDVNGASLTSVATSAADGSYSLRVPVQRTTDAGMPQMILVSLRADADGHQTFPGGVRPPFPIDLATAMQGDAGAWVVENAATTVSLVPLPTAAHGTVAGTIVGPILNGVLVTGGGSSTLSDNAGHYTLFNVMPGSVTVSGYVSGEQLTPATATVTADMLTDHVDLTASQTALSTVSGNVQLVNPGNCTATSVILVPTETFNANVARGEAPRGLRAANVTGAFTINDVPDGHYVVLAAFENDFCVRDPDTSIAGTALQMVDVPMGGNRTVVLSASFKITGALDVRSPGRDAPEGITGTPTFVFASDSSADNYSVVVFDSLGNMVWSQPTITAPHSGDVSVPYAGPALTHGSFYQFRATSFHRGTAISQTEDLRGVFFLQ